MKTIELESVLEVLGLHTTDIPRSNSDCINLYLNYGSHPLAKLYLKDRGYVLRFGYDVIPKSIVETFPSGAIRIKPSVNTSAQY